MMQGYFRITSQDGIVARHGPYGDRHVSSDTQLYNRILNCRSNYVLLKPFFAPRRKRMKSLLRAGSRGGSGGLNPSSNRHG